MVLRILHIKWPAYKHGNWLLQLIDMRHVLRSTFKLRFLMVLMLLPSSMLSCRVEAQTSADRLSGPGEPATNHGITVTLLSAKRLSHEEYRRESGFLYRGWAVDGLRMAFLVENRPGAPLAPAVGEVKVLFNAHQYNSVTHSSSRQPLSPFIIVRDTDGFLASTFGRGIDKAVRVPASRPSVAILDVFIRGDVIPNGAYGVVEIEQGETHRPDAQGRLRPLSSSEIGASWTWFRFRLPPM